MGGAGLERWFVGGLELAGVRAERRRGSGVWGHGFGERTRGMGCGSSCSTAAREKSSSGALSWPGHGDGEVAAGGGFGVAWQGEKRASARGRSGGEV